ncbi:MAG: AEC family transporter [Longicatena sp.]
MKIGMTIITQISMMYIMMIIGYFIYKKKWVSEDGTQQISNILLKICGPCIMMTSFQCDFTVAKLKGLAISFVLSIGVIILGLTIASLVLKKEHRVERFAVGFSNAGFIGIPLVQNLLGNEYIFYLTAFLVAFNLIAWTYGIYLISGRRDLITMKQVFVNPATVGMIIGLIIFVSPIKLPNIIYKSFLSIGNINTPLAMMVLGTYIAKSNVLEVFKSKMAYFVSLLRLVIVPLITLFLLKFVPETLHDIKLVVLIAGSAPVGVMVAMFAQQYKGDFEYGARIVSLSTMLSLLTIPVMILLTSVIW